MDKLQKIHKEKFFYKLYSFLLLLSLLLIFFNNLNIFYNIKNLINLIIFPSEARLSILVKDTNSKIENIRDLINVYDENKILKEKFKNYYNLQNKIFLLEAENKSLLKFLDINRKIDNKTETCRVIGRTVDDWYSAIIINKGLKNGINKKNIVVSVSNNDSLILIGQVIEVYDNYSKVLLITDMDSNIISVISRENIFGIVNGTNSDELEMNIIGKVNDIKVGEKVFTSGLGGIFQAGLYIGEISKVMFENHGMIKKVFINPFEDIKNLDFVTVIKD
jgi:rod shape-determining protein MreC